MKNRGNQAELAAARTSLLTSSQCIANLPISKSRGDIMTYKTGQIVQKSGIYRCIKDGKEITCVKGEPFPPCAICHGTEFTLVRETRK